MVPPTVMFKASIVLVNQPAAAARLGRDLADDPRSEEHDEEGDVPACRRADVTENERPERRENSPQPDAARVEESAERDHRQRRREQDVDLADPE